MWRRLEDGPIIYRVSNCCAMVLKDFAVIKKEGKEKEKKTGEPKYERSWKAKHI